MSPTSVRVHNDEWPMSNKMMTYFESFNWYWREEMDFHNHIAVYINIWMFYDLELWTYTIYNFKFDKKLTSTQVIKPFGNILECDKK